MGNSWFVHDLRFGNIQTKDSSDRLSTAHVTGPNWLLNFGAHTTTDISSKNINRFAKAAKFPGNRQVVWLFQGYFLSAWHFAILGRCAWKIAMETCWWAQLRSASRSERVNWSNWDILTKKQFGSIKSLEHFGDLRIWSKSLWILTFKSQLGRWSLRSQFRIAVCCGRPWVWVPWCPAPFQNVTQTERFHERVISPSV
jgi:hypothetical protein